MKKAVCLQHAIFEGPGYFEKVLGECGYSIQRFLVPQAGLPPDPGDFLLIMGGPMSVNDPDAWIASEIQFIQKAMSSGIPCLGVCLGSQMMARAMGGSVYRGAEWEIGMTPVHVTDAGRKDHVVGQLPPQFEAFQWHREGIALPESIEILATSKLFPVQAFRNGPSAYGLLFHVEMDMDGVDQLCSACEMDLAQNRLTGDDVQRQVESHLPRHHEFARKIITAMTATPSK